MLSSSFIFRVVCIGNVCAPLYAYIETFQRGRKRPAAQVKPEALKAIPLLPTIFSLL